MYAYVTKHEEHTNDALLCTQSGEVFCAVVDYIQDIPQGCRRVPLSVAKVYMFRQSSSWITPDSSAQGEKMFAEKRADFLRELSSSSSSPDRGSSRQNSSPSVMYEYQGDKISLVEMQHRREMKNRYKR